MENWIANFVSKVKSNDVLLPLAAGATTSAITYVLLKQYYLQPSVGKSEELQRKLEQVRILCSICCLFEYYIPNESSLGTKNYQRFGVQTFIRRAT